MSERDFLRQQLRLLTRSHYDAVQPILKRLAAIEAMTTRPLYVVDPGSVEEFGAPFFVPDTTTGQVRPNCACFPGTCREQVDKDGVTVSGNRCKTFKPTTARVAQLEAERDALRAALQVIADQHSGEVCSTTRSDCMASLAKVALR